MRPAHRLGNRHSSELIIALLLFLAGCTGPAAVSLSGTESAKLDPAVLLGNMPVNKDLRCTGISLVAEAVLEGESDDTTDTPENVSHRLYECLFSRQRLKYPSLLLIDGVPHSITSRAALDRLTDVVTRTYNEQYERLSTTERGRAILLAAQNRAVRNLAELDSILTADRDHIAAFGGTGTRQLEGEAKHIAHMFLISRARGGEYHVYDPNDPGASVPCRLDDTGDLLHIEWTCRFRDTGQLTTQTFYIVPTKTYFPRIFERE